MVDTIFFLLPSKIFQISMDTFVVKREKEKRWEKWKSGEREHAMTLWFAFIT